MKRILLSVIASLAVFGSAWHDAPLSVAPANAAEVTDAGSALASAFEKHARNIRVEGRGTVAKILPDDNDGSRHQRFIVRLGSGQSILIAHNIDLAQRVAPLRVGNVVSFSGEYVWNPKGGIVHWTHRDPSGRRPAGWIRNDS